VVHLLAFGAILFLNARFEEEDRAEREQMDHEQHQSTVSA
jgi:hypothetical protein